jgi:lipocalin
MLFVLKSLAIFSLVVVSVSARENQQHRRRRLQFGIGLSNFFDKLFGRNKNCPPDNFKALENFDLSSYVNGSWYAVKQIPLTFQPTSSFFCVRADYIPDTSSCFLCGDAPKVKIYNQGRRGSVNATVGGTPYTQPPPKNSFRAIQKDPQNQPAKLTVGFLPQFLVQSNYWVVAAGSYANAIAGVAVPTSTTYDWAIITGGSPDLQTSNGLCIPKPGLVQLYGMWMFTRDNVPPTGVISGIDQIATSLGLDNTKWLTVTQEGCVFA